MKSFGTSVQDTRNITLQVIMAGQGEGDWMGSDSPFLLPLWQWRSGDHQVSCTHTTHTKLTWWWYFVILHHSAEWRGEGNKLTIESSSILKHWICYYIKMLSYFLYQSTCVWTTILCVDIKLLLRNARPLSVAVFPEQVHYTLQQQTTLIVMTHLWRRDEWVGKSGQGEYQGLIPDLLSRALLF